MLSLATRCKAVVQLVQDLQVEFHLISTRCGSMELHPENVLMLSFVFLGPLLDMHKFAYASSTALGPDVRITANGRARVP
jgi:hypothetical protein